LQRGVALGLLVRHQIVDVLAGAGRKGKLPHALVVAEAVPAASRSRDECKRRMAAHTGATHIKLQNRMELEAEQRKQFTVNTQAGPTRWGSRDTQSLSRICPKRRSRLRRQT
jgi:hypothetical protein